MSESELNQSQPDDDPFDLEREPLDRQPGFDIDWGGDGSDLMRPVRTHVLAALRPATGPYEPPIDALLDLGNIGAEDLDQRADELGVGQQHVTELARMARDRALVTADGEHPAAWAPTHALHLLERFDTSDIVTELISLLDIDYELYSDRLIDIIGTVGSTALPHIVAYVRDRTRWDWGRFRAASILQNIAEQHPETREQVIAVLREALADAENDNEQPLTGVVSALISLEATDELPLIRRAFELGKIDEMVYGPWGEVLKHLGIEPDPDDPLIEESRQRFEQRHNDLFPRDFLDTLALLGHQQTLTTQRAGTQKRKQDKARKEKQKRKTASASRKANRKKRK